MKKLTSLLLCMVLVLSMFCVNAAAAPNTGMEARATVANDGTVTVVVTAKQSTANARLDVTFDSDDLTYTGYETAFAVHSAKAEEEKLTIGLANASANAVAAGGELVKIQFEMTGSLVETAIVITTADGETLTVIAEASGNRFQDVTAGQWFYEAVECMAANGYMQGMSQTMFGPGVELNRAMMVTILYRIEGSPAVEGTPAFTDVPADEFYTAPVAWAVANGITTGVSENLFAPANPVTREQMVVFLHRYVASKGEDVTVADPEAVLAQFPEAASVSHWATDAFAWAVDRGVITGMDGLLAPQSNCNRAQVAVMLYRFFFEQ